MRKLYIQGLCLLIPFFAWAGFSWLVNTYDIFWPSLPIPPSVKRVTLNRDGATMPRDWTLYKVHEYNRQRTPVVMFGDSRAFDFSAASLRKAAGTEMYNFGVPGANLPSMIELFWFAAERSNLKRVYFQLSFHTSGVPESIASAPLAIFHNPLLYFVDHGVTRATLDTARRHWAPAPAVPAAGHATGSRFENWPGILRYYAKLLRRGVNDERIYADLKRVVEYCRKNSIEVTFINMPVHPVVPQLIRDMKLEPAHTEYLRRLSALAPTHDFDRTTTLRIPEGVFRDPLHLPSEYYDQIIVQVLRPVGPGRRTAQ
jgi:hypothetical protein